MAWRRSARLAKGRIVYHTLFFLFVVLPSQIVIHHEFIIDNCTVWVKGDVSKLEAFASIHLVPADQLMGTAFALNFPLTTPLKTKELDMLPRPPSRAHSIVRCPIGPQATSRARQAPAKGPKGEPLRVPHNHIAPAAVLEALDRLQCRAGPSMLFLRQQEELLLPSVKYSLSNTKLLPQLCHPLLHKCGTPAAHRR